MSLVRACSNVILANYVVGQLEVYSMNFMKSIAGSSLALMLTFTAPVAWGQSVPQNVRGPAGVVGASGAGPGHDSASLMDQTVSREIKQAWSEGKNATGAMAFQENGE